MQEQHSMVKKKEQGKAGKEEKTRKENLHQVLAGGVRQNSPGERRVHKFEKRSETRKGRERRYALSRDGANATVGNGTSHNAQNLRAGHNAVQVEKEVQGVLHVGRLGEGPLLALQVGNTNPQKRKRERQK